MDSHLQLVRLPQNVAVAFVALCLVLSACAGKDQGELAQPTPRSEEPASEPGRPPALVDLEGIWRRDGTDEEVWFRLDGTYEIGAGLPEFPPVDAGTFEIQGSSITFTSGKATTHCTAGDKLVWQEVELLGPGRMKVYIARDTCSGFFGTDASWTRISG